MHAELLGHPGHLDLLALVAEGGVAGDHEQALKAREIGDDVLGDTVDEILLLGIARHVVERQYDDGGLVG